MLAVLLIYVGADSVNAVYEKMLYKNSNLSAKIKFSGQSPGEQMGSEIVIGDFNSDANKDIAISSTFFSSDEKTWRGKVSIYWGPEYSDNQKTEIIGDENNDQLGTALSRGDINDDGVDDLIVGAYKADFEKNDSAGQVYIFNGDKNFSNKKKLMASSANIIFHGEQANERLGLSLASGDVNGDDVEDLLISAPGAEGEQSKVYVLLGGSYFPDNHRFEVKKDALIIIYGTKDDLFGSDLSIGDYNGDGIGDITIGAYSASSEGKEQNGKVYVIKGRVITASRDTNNKLEYDLLKYPGISKIFFGKQSKEWFGFSTLSQNTNDDDFDDLIIGSFMYLYKSKSGKMTIYHGGADFFEPTNDNYQIQVIGDDTQNLLGAAFGMGDINGDGNQEMIMGAPGISLSDAAGPGALYFLPEINHSADGTFLFEREILHAIFFGDQNDDWFGAAVSVSDLNNDGIDDIVVGAPYSDSEIGSDNGSSFIYWGSQENLFVNENKKESLIGRGEAVSQIIGQLEIRARNEDFLNKCEKNIQYCLFTFSAQSKYSDLSLEKLILYPDVPQTYQYYDDINIATMLDLVHGYTNMDESPFGPEETLKRVHAVKIILGAMNELSWKYKFELEKMYNGKLSEKSSVFDDVSSDVSHMWWYTRYLNRAAEVGLVAEGGLFRPDDDISRQELAEMLTNAKKYLVEREA